MHRNALKARLTAYRARWPIERTTLSRFEAFVDSYPDCFNHSCAIGHITGSAWIVDRTGQRVLLTHHRRLRRWPQLGGHSAGNPDTLAVALREAREESGLDVQMFDETIFDLDVPLIPARDPEPAHSDGGTRNIRSCQTWQSPERRNSRSEGSSRYEPVHVDLWTSPTDRREPLRVVQESEPSFLPVEVDSSPISEAVTSVLPRAGRRRH